MSRQLAERRARKGESIAAWWLRLHGWRILAVRARTPVGEVDLIARRFRTVAFIEVKSRATAAELDLAIDDRRLVGVAAAADYLAARYTGPRDDIRIDVILLCPKQLPRHLINVWHG